MFVPLLESLQLSSSVFVPLLESLQLLLCHWFFVLSFVMICIIDVPSTVAIVSFRVLSSLCNVTRSSVLF